MTQRDVSSGTGHAPEAIDALLRALEQFEREHPEYIPKLGDGVIWSEDGIRPKFMVYKVIAIARAEGEHWNVTIEPVAVDELPTELQREAVTRVVPAKHLARSADVLTDIFRLMSVGRGAPGGLPVMPNRFD